MFEAFSVAIRLRLVDGISSGIMGLSRHFAIAGKQATELESRLKRIGRTAALGTGMTVAGMGIFAALKPAVEDAKEFQTQVARFQTFGLSAALNDDAVRFVKTTKVIGASYTDLMRSMVEAQGVFRESGLNGPEALAGAKLAVPVLARIHFANAALDPEEQGRRDASGLQMIRFIEMRGGLGDARKFNEIADAGFKAIQSSGGNVNWEQFRQFMATGGVSAQGLSNTALFGQMEPIIGELKGGRAGTSLMTAYNRIEGLTRVPNQVAHELVKQGLWDGSKITWNSQGGIKTVNGNPLRDAATFASSPIDFYQRDLLPMYRRMGLDQAAILRENTLIFGRTGGAMFSLIDRALHNGTIQGSVASQAKALGVNASVAIAGNTVAGQEAAMRANFKNVLIDVGTAALPVLSRLLTTITPMLQRLSDWAVAHPKLFDGLVNGLITLGAALVIGGTITNIVATAQALKLVFDVFGGAKALTGVVGFLPRIFAGLRMVGTVIGTLATAVDWPVLLIAAAAAAIGVAIFQIWKHWDSTKSVWGNIRNEFGMFVSFIGGIPGKLWGLLPDWARKLLGGAFVAAPAPSRPLIQPNASGVTPLDRAMHEQFGRRAPAVDHPIEIRIPFLTSGGAHAAGQNVAKGVAAGVVAAHPAVRAATTGTANQAVDAFKRATDQHSPSRVFAAMGDMLVQGLIMGVERSAPGLLSRLGDLGRAAMGSMRGLGGAGGDFTQRLTSNVAERAGQAMAFFKAHGWSGAQAAGIVSNLVRESGLNAAAVNARSGAYGVTQWLGSRVRDFAAFTGHALRGSSLLDQLRFTDHELRTTHASVGRALLAARTPGAAAALINGRFEINGVAGEGGRRAALASQLASLTRPTPAAIRFGNMPPVQPTPTTPSRSPYVQPRGTHVTVHTKTMLDGRVLTETVTRHQAHDASRPHAGTSTFDPTMSAAPVGLGYHP